MKQLFYFVAMYAGSSVLLKGVGFVLSIWMARALPVDSFGRWGLLYAVQTALASFCSVGIADAIVALLRQHERSSERRLLFSAANTVFLYTAAVSVLVVVAGIGILVLTGTPLSSVALCGAVASGVLLAFSTLQAQLERLNENHFASITYGFSIPFSGLIGSAIAVAIEQSAASFFIGSSIGMIIVLMILNRPHIGFDRSSEARTRRELIMVRLWPFIGITLLGWLSGYGNNFVVGAAYQTSEVARFTFALSIGSVMQLAASALNQVWSPRFYKLAHEQDIKSIERNNWRFYGLQSLLLGGLSAICLILFPHAIKIVGGNLLHYASMRLELFFMLAGYIFLSPWAHCSNYFLLHDMGSKIMRITLVSSMLGLSIWFALMWVIGPLGIYIGFFVQMIVRSIGIVYYARRFWPVTICWIGVAVGLLFPLVGLLSVMP